MAMMSVFGQTAGRTSSLWKTKMETPSRSSTCAGVVGSGMSTRARVAAAAGGVPMRGFSSATFLGTRALGPLDPLFFFPHYPDTRVSGYTFIKTRWHPRYFASDGEVSRLNLVKKEKSWCIILSSFDSEYDTTPIVF